MINDGYVTLVPPVATAEVMQLQTNTVPIRQVTCVNNTDAPVLLYLGVQTPTGPPLIVPAFERMTIPIASLIFVTAVVTSAGAGSLLGGNNQQACYLYWSDQPASSLAPGALELPEPKTIFSVSSAGSFYDAFIFRGTFVDNFGATVSDYTSGIGILAPSATYRTAVELWITAFSMSGVPKYVRSGVAITAQSQLTTNAWLPLLVGNGEVAPSDVLPQPTSLSTPPWRVPGPEVLLHLCIANNDNSAQVGEGFGGIATISGYLTGS